MTTTSTASTLEGLRVALVAEADTAHLQHPQYREHWGGWRVAEVTRRIRTKLGVAFEPGDLVLVSPKTYDEKVAPSSRSILPYAEWPTKTFGTAYSRRNGVDTAVPVRDIREVQIVAELAR